MKRFAAKMLGHRVWTHPNVSAHWKYPHATFGTRGNPSGFERAFLFRNGPGIKKEKGL